MYTCGICTHAYVHAYPAGSARTRWAKQPKQLRRRPPPTLLLVLLLLLLQRSFALRCVRFLQSYERPVKRKYFWYLILF